MKQRYNPDHPIDVLFKQIESSVEFATNGQSPFTARQIVNTAFLLIFATGAYEDECKIWKRRAPATQTWANFKVDFMAAYKNRRELKKLQAQDSATQLFGANVMNAKTTEDETVTSPTDTSTITDFYSETTEKINAIANATIESGTHVANLARENDSLREQLNAMNRILTSMQCTIIGNNNSPAPAAVIIITQRF